MKTIINYRCYKCYHTYDEETSYKLEKVTTSTGFVLPYCVDCDWFCVPFRRSYKYANAEKQKLPKRQPRTKPNEIRPYQFAPKKDLFA